MMIRPFSRLARLARLSWLSLLCVLSLQIGASSLWADSEWRPWADKIHARLVDNLTAPQRSALPTPPVRLIEGKATSLATAGRQVVVSDAALELWSRLALAIGRDTACPGYLAEFLRRCSEAPEGLAALPDPAEIPTKKARKPVVDDRNQQLTAFSQLAATLIGTELAKATMFPTTEASSGSEAKALLSDAQALDVLREGTRLAARSGYTSEALQSLINALPTGAPTPAWAGAFLPSQPRGAALAKDIKKVERKALGR